MKKREIEKRVARTEQTDYARLGLRCGIEIHQRLDTHKLFCPCSSKQSAEPTDHVQRRLRAVAGELGEVDQAALYEYMKSKSFIYKISPGESCLVELDCEPPHALNRDALIIGLQLCKLLDCDVPEELHVMRKTVIDGSNTGGFQRTTVIGMNGSLKMPFGNVVIEQVCLEEEAARIEQRSDGQTTYRLSGLGIPLLEITTSILDDPKKTFETAKALGLLLRSLRVQRGIGTIRQDINISIADGARVEIKGFQELAEIPKLIETEAKRQTDLLEIKQELIKRKSKSKPSIIDVTDVFAKTENNIIRKIVADGGRVLALLLPEFAGLLKHVCGDRTLGAELAGYAKAYGLGGMIHTDEDIPKYKLVDEFERIRKRFEKPNPQDAIIIFAGRAPSVDQAAQAVLDRALRCEHGVPEETRVADNTGSKYARPLPGRARMYPETDIPPIPISRAMLDAITVPKTLEERGENIAKQLPKDMVEQILKSYFYLPTFERLSKDFDPVLVARMLVYTLKELKRDGHNTDILNDDDFREILYLITNEKIPTDSLSGALLMKIEGKTAKDIESKFAVMPEHALRRYIREIVEQNRDKREQVIMGIIMSNVRGRARGETVIRILREEIEAAKLR